MLDGCKSENFMLIIHGNSGQCLNYCQSFSLPDDSDMMNSDEIDKNGQQFLIQLFEQTKGDPTVQVSMYDN